jgi:hypothetical protein
MDTATSNFMIYVSPLLMLLGVYFLFFRILKRQKINGDKINSLNEKIVKQNYEVIGVLRDIKGGLENRKP